MSQVLSFAVFMIPVEVFKECFYFDRGVANGGRDRRRRAARGIVGVYRCHIDSCRPAILRGKGVRCRSHLCILRRYLLAFGGLTSQTRL